ncbi:ThiF family adenylyltransferase [Paenibacillus oenotherae]|uniref:ThiF family adenylyltransferase n=2 Tax=Paenibacillus oenotherae TaxID=1435645 RepID=A0ABS7D4T6_9BACL|nr:ThiF family adenylyltransferase [Paenibacillus oenotherae]
MGTAVEADSPSSSNGNEQGGWAERYSRQTRFSPIGMSGQKKLREATVFIVGSGALGASLAQHMVRAGVGTVKLADRDYVEPSNLQRQMLFDEEDARLALPKAVAAVNKLRRINSSITIQPFVVDVTEGNAQQLIEGADLVLDGTDNAAARLLLSDVCFRAGIPFFYGGVAGAQGMSAVLVPGATSCLRCLIGGDEQEEGAETCDTIGVISPIVEWIASMQAVEALKWLTGNGDALRKTWLTAHLWPFRVYESALPRPVPGCAICSANAGEEQHGKHDHAEIPRTVTLCGRDSVQVTLDRRIDLPGIERAMTSQGCIVTANPYLVRAHITDAERLVIFPDGRILVQGTQDPLLAVTLCNRYVVSVLDC